jgi:hypothetical protein
MMKRRKNKDYLIQTDSKPTSEKESYQKKADEIPPELLHIL